MKSNAITSQTELAKALGCKQSNVSRMVRRADWKFGKGPWKRSQIPAMQRWRAETLKPGAPEKPKPENASRVSEKRESKLDAEVRKLNAQADEAETALARERKRLLIASDVAEEWERIGQRLSLGLRNFPSQVLPVALTMGMPVEASTEFQEKVDELLRGTLRVLSDAGQREAEEAA